MIQRQLWAISTSVLREHLISYPQVHDYKQQPNKLFKTSPSLVTTKRKHNIVSGKNGILLKSMHFISAAHFFLSVVA